MLKRPGPIVVLFEIFFDFYLKAAVWGLTLGSFFVLARSLRLAA